MKKIYVLIVLLCVVGSSAFPQNESQQKIRLTLENVVELAREESPMATMARHQFRSSYWEFRSFKAGFLPSLSLEASLPNVNRMFERKIKDDGTEGYVYRNSMSNSLDLRLSQNVGFTGGSIYMRSSLNRNDNFGDPRTTHYLSNPVSIGFYQPINGYNELKWQKKIEPAKYEEAKKELIYTLEQVSNRSVGYFFDLILAQINVSIAEKNYANNDTLYHIAEGRYQLGTIAENELLQMELSWLNAGSEMNAANIDLEVKKFRLRSFLGLGSMVDVELIVPKDIPEMMIDYGKALQEANLNNPDILQMQRQLLEAEKSVDMAKSQRGLQANIFAQYGLSSNQAVDIHEAYQDPQDMQQLQIGFEIPILDWGEGRGKFKMAQSSQEVVKTNVEQSRSDFEQQIFLQVMQFNQQDDQLLIASKADTIAEKRYEVTKQRFLIGKIDVLDLNVALEEKDVARRRYVQALRSYWDYYYSMRILTLYDWLNEVKLEQDFDEILLY